MQQRAIKTRQKILNTATEEFSRHGLHGTRVDVIADKANINKQRIYAYFGGKEELFTEVLRVNFNAVSKEEARILTKLTDKDIPFLAGILLKNYISMYRKNIHFWRLIAWENLEGGKHSGILRNIKEPVFQHLRKLYKKGQDMGYFNKDCSFITFIFVLYSISYFYFANRETVTQSLGIDMRDLKTREKILEEIIRFLTQGKQSAFRG